MKRLSLLLCFVAAGLGHVSCPPPDPPDDESTNFDALPEASATGFLAEFSLRGRWPQQSLTYFIASFTNDISQQSQRDIIEQAFNSWAAVIPLNFTETAAKQNADFVIGFGSSGHCELYAASNNTQCFADAAFDGPSGVLAHCYFPPTAGVPQDIAGDAHFDDAEDYTDDNNSQTATRLLEVAIHELGHGLGLDHSDDQNAIMFPSYSPNRIKLQLGADDIAGVQELYGARDGSVAPEQPEMPEPPTNVPTEPVDPEAVDSDGDMIPDDIELYWIGTNPNDADTDDDGLIDYEIAFGLDPLNPDTDGDGFSDGEEVENGMDPFVPDFAGGGGDFFAGVYFGQDFFGSGIAFQVFPDSSVEGIFTIVQYGFQTDIFLFGAIDEFGNIVMISPDYYFYFEGFIDIDGFVSGLIFTADGAIVEWVAAFDSLKSDAPLSKDELVELTGGARAPMDLYVPSRSEKRQSPAPVHYRVNWREEAGQ